MELRDMPAWLRDMIEPVHLTTPDGEASAEIAGVHVWGTQGPTGATAVAPPDMPPVVLGATEDRPTAAVTSPGAIAAPGTGAVSLSGMGAPPVGGVRAPTAGDFTTAGVTISPMAAEWDEALASIEALDDETLAQAGQVLAMIRERGMSPEEFSAWVGEREITPQVLASALLMVGFHRHDNYPSPQPEALVVASGLSSLATHGRAQDEAIPPFGRLWLAIYFCRCGSGGRALAVFSSMTDEELRDLPRESAVMGMAHAMDNAPEAAAEMITRYATATSAASIK